MATEYKLSYTASEIDRMLGEVDKPKSYTDLIDKPFEKKIKLTPFPNGECLNFETIQGEYNGLPVYYAEGVWLYDSNYNPSALTIEFDGQLYEVDGRNEYLGYVYGETEMVMIGYYNNEGEIKEEWAPFATLYRNNGTYIFTKEPGIHTLKAYTAQTEVKTLDTEFLPKGYPTVSYEQKILVDNVSFEGVAYEDATTLDVTLVENASYKVVFNGTEYNCDSFTSTDIPDMIFIGNTSMVAGADNGIPFCIGYNIGNETSTIMVVESGTHTITIEGMQEEVAPMAEKFIPDTIARKTDMINTLKEGVPAPMFIHRLDGNNMYKIAYGNGVFVAINSYMDTSRSSYLYSTDGINWVEKQLPAAKYWVDVTFGNNTFVAIGNYGSLGSSNNYPYIAYSLDGETWSEATVPSTVFNIASIHFINNEFLVDFNSYYQILRSKDGVTWSKLERADTRVGRGILAYNNGVYVSSSNGMQYTEDALDSEPSWISISEIDRTSGTYYVCYGDNKFIAVDSSGKYIYYSNDGIDWEIATMPVDFVPSRYTNDLTVPVYTHGMFVVYSVYSRQFLYSTNGITWYATSGELVREGHSIYPFSVGDAMYFTYGAEEEPWGTIITHMDVGCITGLARTSDVEKKYATKEYAESLTILTSPNGTKYKLSVADDGTVSAVAVE